jgi:hypothetical protein
MRNQIDTQSPTANRYFVASGDIARAQIVNVFDV